MIFLRFIAFTSLLLSYLSGKEPPLSIQLVSSVTQVHPGQDFYLGLSLHHAPGYHTYWQHPGIVGVPTHIEWEGLPQGCKVEPISWPEPEHVFMFKINCQGYERDVVLPMRVRVSSAVKASTLTFKGKATWMCCNKECNPGLQELKLSLPVTPSDTAQLDPTWAEKIQSELALQPQTSALWSASCTQQGKQVTLTLKPAPGAALLTKSDLKKLRFFTLDGFIDSDQPQTFSLADDGQLTATLAVADYVPGGRPAQLKGLLLRRDSWEPQRRFRGLEFRTRLP